MGDVIVVVNGEAALDMARAVADAVLFEGYLLYPYRASALKNRMRWQFGIIAPPGGGHSEPLFARTECLVEGSAAVLDVRLRFLQLRTRVGDQLWDEGVVREVAVRVPLAQPEAVGDTGTTAFELPGGEESEDGATWRSLPLSGAVRIEAEPLAAAHSLRRVRVTVENRTAWDGAAGGRDAMLRRSLVSTHTMLAVRDGRFLSLLDPPDWARSEVGACRNEHTWPVLIGEPGRDDVMLSSPIVLYDHPAVAAQSPGDLFDATEIDEILILRTMTLTDAEKQEARATDPRAAAIIDRIENMPDQVLERLHGTLRFPRETS